MIGTHAQRMTLKARSLAGSRAGLRRVGIERRRRLARDVVLALENLGVGVDEVLALVLAHGRTLTRSIGGR